MLRFVVMDVPLAGQRNEFCVRLPSKIECRRGSSSRGSVSQGKGGLLDRLPRGDYHRAALSTPAAC